MCFGLQGYGGKSAISLTEWQTTRGKSPWMAILGATRQDAALPFPLSFHRAASYRPPYNQSQHLFTF
ncbi:MAG: hypothetical protein K2N15_15345 [Lachnospiraceae bacterium]|nr:hypothetical protein [Lachnospiraceae bacterium]